MVFSAIDDQETDEDIPLVLELDVVDVDGPFLVFTSEHSGNATLEFSSNILTVSPDADWSGDIFISITAFDGEFSRSQSFNLTVNAVNDAPVLDFISDQVIDEDFSMIISLSGSDIDSEELSFDFELDGNASGTLNGSQLEVSPDADFNGDIAITVYLTDGDLTVSQSFNLNVDEDWLLL